MSELPSERPRADSDAPLLAAAEVLIVGTGDGDSARTRDLVQALERCGAKVARLIRPLFPEAGRDRLGALAFGRGLLRLPGLHRALIHELPKPRPDLILIPYPGHLDAPALVPALRRRYGPEIPVALDLFVGLHETLVVDRRRIPPGSVRARTLLGLDRRAAASVDWLITDTPEHGRLWIQSGIQSGTGGGEGSEPVVVPLGGDPRLLELDLDDDTVEQARNAETVELVHVGRHIPLHGGETILAALAALPSIESLERRRSLRLTMIGEGQERARLEVRARELGIDVVFEPERGFEAMIRRLRSADLVLGTFGRGPKAEAVVPQKVLDALACGRPLITADTAPQRRACRDGEAAWLVPPGDPQALAAAIDKMFDETTRAQFASRAREAFEEWSDPRRRLAALGRRFRDHGRVKTEP